MEDFSKLTLDEVLGMKKMAEGKLKILNKVKPSMLSEIINHRQKVGECKFIIRECEKQIINKI